MTCIGTQGTLRSSHSYRVLKYRYQTTEKWVKNPIYIVVPLHIPGIWLFLAQKKFLYRPLFNSGVRRYPPPNGGVWNWHFTEILPCAVEWIIFVKTRFFTFSRIFFALFFRPVKNDRFWRCSCFRRQNSLGMCTDMLIFDVWSLLALSMPTCSQDHSYVVHHTSM